MANHVKQFANLTLVEDMAGHVPKDYLYTQYLKWCKDKVTTPYKVRAFNKVVHETYPTAAQKDQQTIKGHNVLCWGGLRFKDAGAMAAFLDGLASLDGFSTAITGNHVLGEEVKPSKTPKPSNNPPDPYPADIAKKYPGLPHAGDPAADKEAGP
jgi:phage/plasmid-associated DNA primase